MTENTKHTEDITNPEGFVGPAYNNPIQRIKVIGVGGGGNNAVIHMHKKGIKDVSFVLLNTDRQVLDDSTIPTKVLIGPGRGAGGKPERARKYAEESAEKIAELFDDETDMVFITAGMGGGTGTGAAPVVARIAKERGILTVGIVTVPFIFEGEKRVLKALEGAEEMAKNVDSLLVINNQRLTEIYQNLDIFNAFAKADDTLLNAAQSITDIITNRGVINRDFNDVDTTLREGGSAIISTGYGEGPNRVTDAIQDALHSPLLKNTDIFSSKKLLLVLYVSDDPEKHPFNMEETAALHEFVAGIDSEVDVLLGLYRQPGLDDKVRITILASGFEISKYDEIASETPVIPQPQRRRTRQDKRIEDTYGSLTPMMKNGQIIDPENYDNPDHENVRELETKPALERNSFRKFASSVGASSFRGTSNHESQRKRNNGSLYEGLAVKPNNKKTEKGLDKESDGSMMLKFDDVD